MKNSTGKTSCRNKAIDRSILFSTFFIVTLLFNPNLSYSQAAGDYRSNSATLNWSSVAGWQKYNGSSWVAANDYPGQNSCTGCTVTMLNGHSVTLDVSPANSIGSIIVGGGTSGSLNLGAGSYTLANAGNLTVNPGATLDLNTATFTVSGTTSTSGTVTDGSNTGVNTFTGLVTKSAGTWTSTSVTTAANLVFTNGFTNTSGSFSAGAATIGDNQTLTGTVNMSFANGVTVQGNADLTIAGTSSTGVSFGGSSINYTVRNLTLSGLLTASTTGNLTVTGTTNITGSGGFLDNNNTGVTTFSGAVTVGSSGTFTATAVTTVGNLVFAAGITQGNTAASAFSAGSIRTSASQTWSGAGDIYSSGTINVNSGTLTNNCTGIVTSGGTLTGNILVQGTNATLSLSSTTPLSITTLTSTANGNTVDYHSPGAATMRAQTYYHLTISGSGNKVIPSSNITVNGNLTITAGVLSNTTNNRDITLGGNWVNNAGTGGFAAGSGLVTLSGSSPQTLGGSYATTFNDLTINNSTGITQTANATVSGTLNLSSGVITTGSNRIIIPSGVPVYQGQAGTYTDMNSAM